MAYFIYVFTCLFLTNALLFLCLFTYIFMYVRSNSFNYLINLSLNTYLLNLINSFIHEFSLCMYFIT
jgi:hypothetical protein